MLFVLRRTPPPTLSFKLRAALNSAEVADQIRNALDRIPGVRGMNSAECHIMLESDLLATSNQDGSVVGALKEISILPERGPELLRQVLEDIQAVLTSVIESTTNKGNEIFLRLFVDGDRKIPGTESTLLELPTISVVGTLE